MIYIVYVRELFFITTFFTLILRYSRKMAIILNETYLLFT